MFKNRKGKDKGFTIVEVMIVLAIGGLIMLVVLLAVPALQRNSRNSSRKNDVGALLGAITEYVTNNSGSLPPNAAALTDLANLSFYTAADINYSGVSSTAVTTAPGTDVNTVYIRNYAKCDGNALATSGATRRNIIAYFFVEGSGDPVPQCQEA